MWSSINPLKAGGPQEDGALQFSRKEDGECLEETQTNLQMQGFRCQMLSSYNVSNCLACLLSHIDRNLRDSQSHSKVEEFYELRFV
ncbi:hypothetical protein QLX08_011562 [Tetragonisca angustula]|uniref:Uncharacterized protein n=1 Tax=Tetragonisca angustula TaxID=166442 RepID=A0AAW0Z7M0_9HYME